MENCYSVYKHTFPNGKVYIGITSIKPKYRWKHNGTGYKGQRLIMSAILKYGWDNIKHEILLAGLTKEEAEAKEIELIAFYKSNKKEYGYNIDNGGNVNKHTEETKRKIIKATTGQKRTNETRANISRSKSGSKHTKETRLKIGLAGKGRKLSEQARTNISNAKKGEKNPNWHKKISRETINKRLQSDFYKKVAQMRQDGTVVKIFDRVNIASQETGICAANISRVCNNIRKSAGGYLWKYL